MRFDTKIAVVVRDDLAGWQALNVTAFLASGICSGAGVPQDTGAIDRIVGEPYEDGSGQRYLPMFRQPVLVFAADRAALTRAYERARSRELPLAVYTDELFKTDNDEDNRAAVRAVPSDELSLAGIAVYGRRNPVDKALHGLRLHR